MPLNYIATSSLGIRLTYIKYSILLPPLLPPTK
jgi:hypothetical protein